MPGVKFAEYNNLESVKELVTDKTCAVIMETVQGEGGIYPADPAFIEGVRRLCDEKDILLILDEIQCGMGRTGEMFAWQNYGVKPDIMTCAKALGCGVPAVHFSRHSVWQTNRWHRETTERPMVETHLSEQPFRQYLISLKPVTF